ncbi:MAG: TetR/AcrR family transcriptional regulator [Actinomycetota bacterium]|nr:TetR/AcrR family transcriptional regulator [Actinomycetota bacterium]
MKTDKRLPASERRKIILDAAMRTFVEYGYQGAYMETIAERADVTKPILYRHFPSKLSLLIALLDQAGEELRGSILRPFDTKEDRRAFIRKDVRSYLDFVENYEGGYRLIYTIGLGIDSEVSERIDNIRQNTMKIVADHIRCFVDTDSVPPEDIELTAAMAVGMAETAALYWIKNEGITREGCESNLIRCVTNILADLPPRTR